MQANERSATLIVCFFFFQAEDGIRDLIVTGVQTCALPISDTYNHKIKRLDPRTGECRTLLGAGAPGHADGAAGAARFSEPSGVSVAAGGPLPSRNPKPPHPGGSLPARGGAPPGPPRALTPGAKINPSPAP